MQLKRLKNQHNLHVLIIPSILGTAPGDWRLAERLHAAGYDVAMLDFHASEFTNDNDLRHQVQAIVLPWDRVDVLISSAFGMHLFKKYFSLSSPLHLLIQISPFLSKPLVLIKVLYFTIIHGLRARLYLEPHVDFLEWLISSKLAFHDGSAEEQAGYRRFLEAGMRGRKLGPILEPDRAQKLDRHREVVYWGYTTECFFPAVWLYCLLRKVRGHRLDFHYVHGLLHEAWYSRPSVQEELIRSIGAHMTALKKDIIP